MLSSVSVSPSAPWTRSCAEPRAARPGRAQVASRPGSRRAVQLRAEARPRRIAARRSAGTRLRPLPSPTPPCSSLPWPRGTSAAGLPRDVRARAERPPVPLPRTSIAAARSAEPAQQARAHRRRTAAVGGIGAARRGCSARRERRSFTCTSIADLPRSRHAQGRLRVLHRLRGQRGDRGRQARSARTPAGRPCASPRRACSSRRVAAALYDGSPVGPGGRARPVQRARRGRRARSSTS